MVSDRRLNWAGHSIEAIAAMYESDSAARAAMAAPEDESAQAYWQSAWRAENNERQLDEVTPKSESGESHKVSQLAVGEDCGECNPCLFLDYNPQDPETHCIDCTCIICVPGA